MTHYILQVILFQLVFLLAYELLLKKETFFNANRAYLLLTPVLSLLLPFLKVEALENLFPVEAVQGISSVWLPEVFIGNQSQANVQLPAVMIEQQGFQINWWLVFYLSGILLSTLLFFKKYQSLNRLLKFRRISEEKEFRIIEVPNSKIACTFYKTVFLGDQLSEEGKQQILSHEMVHVEQKHSLDLIFFELLKIIFWFDPLVYIFQQRIAALHEFIADASVVKTTKKRNYYEQLLNTAFNTQKISFINQFFNHSLIKKRILMLQKSRSKSIAKFKFLIIVPLLLIMLTYVACSENSEGMESDPSISEQLAEIKKAIQDGKELSEVEKEQFFEIMEVIVKNGDAPTPPLPPSPPVRHSQATSGNDVPFAVIDEVPVFPGCEELTSNNARKECMIGKITDFVSTNFNADLGKKLGLTGVNRVIVQFKIDETGQVVDAEARAKSPELEAEAIRVVNALPKMEPGKQRGKEVGVMYSLPIVFQVGE